MEFQESSVKLPIPWEDKCFGHLTATCCFCQQWLEKIKKSLGTSGGTLEKKRAKNYKRQCTWRWVKEEVWDRPKWDHVITLAQRAGHYHGGHVFLPLLWKGLPLASSPQALRNTPWFVSWELKRTVYVAFQGRPIARQSGTEDFRIIKWGGQECHSLSEDMGTFINKTATMKLLSSLPTRMVWS